MNAFRLPTFLLISVLLVSVFVFSIERDEGVEGIPLPVYPVEVSMVGESGDLWFCVGPTGELDGISERTITLTSFSDTDSFGRVTIADDLGNDIEREILLESGQSFDIKPEQSVPGAKWAAVTIEVPSGEVLVKQQITGNGLDVEPCVTTTSDFWHLPWSSTLRPDNEASLLFYNPFQAPAVADLHFVGDVGRRETLDSQGVVIPSRSLVVFDITTRIPDSSVVSATVDVRAGQLVVARMQTAGEGIRKGLDLVYGSNRAAGRVFLTGYEQGSEGTELISILNPNNEFVEVEISFFGTGVQNIQPRKLELRALQRQVLELETFESDNATYGVEVKSFDGQPIAASFISWKGKSSDEESLDIGLTTQNGVDLAARNWKVLLESSSFESGYLSVFNPDSKTIASIKFSNQESSLPFGVPDQIELDGLESVSFPIVDSSIEALDIDSTSPVLVGVVGRNSSGIYFESAVAISKTSETPAS
ncbi:MAG: DUF5719 family protein [Acidimicrobiales bacterium]|nr:DUF5719 family protein [Acidimicrobiales bacterium]